LYRLCLFFGLEKDFVSMRLHLLMSKSTKKTSPWRFFETHLACSK